MRFRHFLRSRLVRGVGPDDALAGGNEGRREGEEGHHDSDEEKIAHDAGAPTAQSMTVHELVRLIREAGRRPIERDTVFNVVKEW